MKKYYSGTTREIVKYMEDLFLTDGGPDGYSFASVLQMIIKDNTGSPEFQIFIKRLHKAYTEDGPEGVRKFFTYEYLLSK